MAGVIVVVPSSWSWLAATETMKHDPASPLWAELLGRRIREPVYTTRRVIVSARLYRRLIRRYSWGYSENNIWSRWEVDSKECRLLSVSIEFLSESTAQYARETWREFEAMLDDGL